MRCYHLLVEHHYLDEARLDLALAVYSPEGSDHYLGEVRLALEDEVRLVLVVLVHYLVLVHLVRFGLDAVHSDLILVVCLVLVVAVHC